MFLYYFSWMRSRFLYCSSYRNVEFPWLVNSRNFLQKLGNRLQNLCKPGSPRALSLFALQMNRGLVGVGEDCYPAAAVLIPGTHTGSEWFQFIGLSSSVSCCPAMSGTNFFFFFLFSPRMIHSVLVIFLCVFWDFPLSILLSILSLLSWGLLSY